MPATPRSRPSSKEAALMQALAHEAWLAEGLGQAAWPWPAIWWGQIRHNEKSGYRSSAFLLCSDSCLKAAKRALRPEPDLGTHHPQSTLSFKARHVAISARGLALKQRHHSGSYSHMAGSRMQIVWRSMAHGGLQRQQAFVLLNGTLRPHRRESECKLKH